jgi:hypothetical protein
MEQIGKITWIGEIQKHLGDLNLGLRIHNYDGFLNIFKTQEELEAIKSSLQKGFEVKVDFEGNTINHLEIINATVEKPEAKKGSFQEQLDKVNYKTLMGEAHRLGIQSTSVEIVPELTNIDKKMACFKATVVLKDGKSFEDFGEACGAEKKDGGNIQSAEIALAYIRMASTRALVRALRQATNNMETAEEEMPNGELPEGTK